MERPSIEQDLSCAAARDAGEAGPVPDLTKAFAMQRANNWENHPCFNERARHHYARVHLPVAPRCNLQCNYCDRKFDCANENRPGVSSQVLTPYQAVWALEQILERVPSVSVVGIAGPGDPMANPQQTLETLRLVRKTHPELALCVATNGLALEPFVDELAQLEVSHMTLTVNAVDPQIGSLIYRWARVGKSLCSGNKAAELLLSRQLTAVRMLKARGIVVKINCIVIPAVNDEHVPEVARTMAELGADLFNAVPLYPVVGTPFGDLPTVSPTALAKIRAQAGKHLPQMTHCQRCRADAVGLLGSEQPLELAGILEAAASQPGDGGSDRPYVAVASNEGLLVNEHLGRCEELLVFGPDPEGGYRVIETRPVPPPGAGELRWQQLAQLLHDCRAVVAGAIGQRPRQVLAKTPVCTIEAEGLITDVLDTIYQGKTPNPPFAMSGCGASCGGGVGCGG